MPVGVCSSSVSLLGKFLCGEEGGGEIGTKCSLAPLARQELRNHGAQSFGDCKGDAYESERSAQDVRIRSGFYAKEKMTQVYLNDQLKIVFSSFLRADVKM